MYYNFTLQFSTWNNFSFFGKYGIKILIQWVWGDRGGGCVYLWRVVMTRFNCEIILKNTIYYLDDFLEKNLKAPIFHGNKREREYSNLSLVAWLCNLNRVACLSARFHPTNVKTTEPIEPKYCVGPYMTPGNVNRGSE